MDEFKITIILKALINDPRGVSSEVLDEYINQSSGEQLERIYKAISDHTYSVEESKIYADILVKILKAIHG